MEKSKTKAAFVAVVGRPSVGKSTLVNKMCGQKVAIVSAVPQTTRNAIRGIVNRSEDGSRGQLVFIDTPGRHKSEKKFNKKLADVSGRAVSESDIILYIMDASRAPGPEETDIVSLLVPHAGKTVVAVNKTDIDEAGYSRALAFLADAFPDIGGDRCYKISAMTGEGVEGLLSALFNIAPEGEPFYGEEYYTDQEVNFRVAEIIREQAINRLREELPHSLYVNIIDTQFSEAETVLSGEQGRPKLWVRALIVVERESQKGMVVGKGGTMIKAIRLAALKELRNIFDWKIELDLRVKTGKDWRQNDRILQKLISN